MIDTTEGFHFARHRNLGGNSKDFSALQVIVNNIVYKRIHHNHRGQTELSRVHELRPHPVITFNFVISSEVHQKRRHIM